MAKKKNLLGELAFNLQLSGIEESDKKIKRMSSSVAEFKDSMRGAGIDAKTTTSMVAELAAAGHDMASELLTTESRWVGISKTVASIAKGDTSLDAFAGARDELAMFAGDLVKQYELLKDDPLADKETLDALSERLDIFKQLVPEQKLMNDESKNLDKHIDFIQTVGVGAFGLLQESMQGVKGVSEDVTAGIGIFKDSFTGAFDTMKNISKTKLFGLDKKMASGKSIIQRLFFGDSDEREYVNKLKNVMKGVGKGVGKTPMRPLPKMPTTFGLGGPMRPLPGMPRALPGAKIAKIAKSSKAAGPVITKLTGTFGKLGAGTGSLTRALTTLGPRIAAIGPVAVPVIAAMVTIGAVVMVAAAAFKFLKRGMSIYIQDMETLRLVNYRALGSIHDLTAASYDISVATGLSSKETLESIRTLSEAGMTASTLSDKYGNSTEALKKFATMQSKFVKSTGASNESVAAFLKRLEASNISLKGAQHQLDKVTLSMKRFGITGNDANQVLGHMSDSLKIMNVMYDEAEIDDYVDSMLGLAAAAKRAGLSMGIVSKIDNELRGLTGGSTTLLALGGHMDELINKGTAMNDLTDKMYDGYKVAMELAESTPDGLTPSLLESLELSAEHVAMFQERYELEQEMARAREAGDWGTIARLQVQAALLKSQTDAQEATDAARQAAAAAYDESMNTMTMALQELFSPMQGEATKVMMGLIEGITKVIKEITPIVHEVMGEAIEVFKEIGKVFMDVFGPWMPFLKATFNVFGIIIGLVFKVVKVLIKLTGVLATPLKMLGHFMSFFAPLFQGAWEAVDFLASGVLNLTGFFIDLFSAVVSLEWLPWVFDKIVEGIKWVLGHARKLGSFFDPLTDGLEWVLEKAIKVKKYFFGSSFLHIKEGIAEISGPLGFMVTMLEMFLSPIIMIKDAFAGAIEFAANFVKTLAKIGANSVFKFIGEFLGVSPETDDIGTSAIKKQIIEVAHISKVEVDSAPIYSSKFDEKARRTEMERSRELVTLQRETVDMLAKILEKADPNGERAANAMERIAKVATDPTERLEPFKSRKGFGEHAVNWWGE